MKTSVIKKLRSSTKLILLLMAAVGLVGMLPVSGAMAADSKGTGSTPYLVVGVSPAIREFEMHSGDHQTVQMTVKNNTKYTEDFKIYAAPYTILNSDYSHPNFDKQTNFSYLSKWITFDQTDYTVEAESDITVEFQIDVPKSVPDGTQYAAVFAETTGYRQDGQKVGIRASGRVGMIVKAKMLDGHNKETAKITNQKIEWFQPDAPLETSFLVDNTGNVEYKIQSRITVNDVFGGRERYKSNWIDTSTFPESKRGVKMDWEQSHLGIYKVTQEVKTMDGKTLKHAAYVLAVPVWVMLLLAIGIIAIIVNIVLIIIRRKSGGSHRKSRSHKNGKGGMKL